MWMVASTGLIALALTGCNKGGPANQVAANTNMTQPTGLPTPPARPGGPGNTGTTQTGPAGLQVDPTAMVNNCISPADQQRPLADITPEQRRTVVACINAAAVQQINGQLPRQIDQVTRLDRVTSEGTLLTYQYTVTAPNLPPNIGTQLQAMTRTTVCGQPQMRQTLELGGAYAYRWVDANGREIATARVDAC
jgi:hypothetical protein